MIDRVTLYTTSQTQPHRNLALEALLTETLPAGEAALMLWQNANAVIIGAGQNAWRECNIAAMEQDGVVLARRPSGGGAVFHDLGNLNFSFLMPRADYDVARQLGVILRAVRTFGIDAEATGRNDLTVEGRKFSGNAFRFFRNRAMHHGTLLLSADMARGSRYLAVDPAKLRAKGVASVRSRVVNLGDLAPVTVPAMSAALETAFQGEYGSARRVNLDEVALPGLDERAAKYASWDWNYAHSPTGSVALEHRFHWGGVQVHFSLQNGQITGAQAFTDAMDENLAQTIAAALEGCPCRGAAVRERLAPIHGDLAEWLSGAL